MAKVVEVGRMAKKKLDFIFFVVSLLVAIRLVLVVLGDNFKQNRLQNLQKEAVFEHG